jgi:hypothetical protein
VQAVEFTTELSADPAVLTGDDIDDDERRKAGYEQFMREDAPEDSVYDKYC